MPNHTFPIGKLHPGKKYLGKRSKKARKQERKKKEKQKKEEARSTESKIPISTMSKLLNKRIKHILFIINHLQW